MNWVKASDFLMIPYFRGLQFVTYGNSVNYSGVCAKHFAGYYGIQYCHHGSFYLALDHNEPVIYNGPHAFISYPGPYFDYGSIGERHHVFCCFQGDRVQDYLRERLLIPDLAHPVIRITRPDQFYSTMQSLQSVLRHSFSSETPERAVLLLEDLLLQLQEQPLYPDTEQHLYHPLHNLAEDIRQNPQLDWDLNKEAHNVGISLAYLRKLFTIYFNCAPHNYILECRIQRATDLLLYHQNLSIAEVSEQAGFQDPYYFSRIFKKRKGFSPLRFRAVFAP